MEKLTILVFTKNLTMKYAHIEPGHISWVEEVMLEFSQDKTQIQIVSVKNNRTLDGRALQ